MQLLKVFDMFCTPDGIVGAVVNDVHPKNAASKYITRYAETVERWDSNSEEEKRNKHNDQSFTNAYQSLSDTKLSLFAKYNSAKTHTFLL